jgi:hypothetical protein
MMTEFEGLRIGDVVEVVDVDVDDYGLTGTVIAVEDKRARIEWEDGVVTSCSIIPSFAVYRGGELVKG